MCLYTHIHDIAYIIFSGPNETSVGIYIYMFLLKAYISMHGVHLEVYCRSKDAFVCNYSFHIPNSIHGAGPYCLASRSGWAGGGDLSLQSHW